MAIKYYWIFIHLKDWEERGLWLNLKTGPLVGKMQIPQFFFLLFYSLTHSIHSLWPLWVLRHKLMLLWFYSIDHLLFILYVIIWYFILPFKSPYCSAKYSQFIAILFGRQRQRPWLLWMKYCLYVQSIKHKNIRFSFHYVANV